jgi:beta-lactamase regulating signal transducer with metallopeptidase domain/protocatechuate 3,4-dioxygenase beta subunit
MTWYIPIWTWLAHAAVGTLLVLAAGCLGAALSRQPVRKLRLLELTLAGCLLAPWLSLVSGLPQWSLGWLESTEQPDSSAAASRATAVTAVAQSDWRNRDSLDQAELAARTQQSLEEKAGGIVPPTPSSEPTPQAPEAPQLATLAWPSTPQMIVAAYIAVSAGLLAWWLVGLLRLAYLYRRTTPAPAYVRALFRQIAGSAGDRVELVCSDRMDMPLTFTWRRPVIVLPRALCLESEESALRFCFAHEWSHIERCDIWSWHLASMAQILFFFQPLYWWLRRQLRLCQDYLADARAARQGSMAEDYAEYLVGLARRRMGSTVPATLGIGDRRSNLYRRVLMLLNARQPLEQRCRLPWSAAYALGILVLLAAVAVVRLDAAGTGSAPDDKAAAQEKKETPKQEQKDKPKAEAVTYTGRVFDKDTDKNIPGAVVTVRRSVYADHKPHRILEESKHTTNAEGKYTFTIPAEQAAEYYLYIELDVEARGYAPRKHFGYSFAMIRKNEKMGGRPFFENVDLRPAAEITGIVETPEGKPASDVKVLAYSNTSKNKEGEFEYGSFADVKTDKDGKFSLWIITPGPAVFWILPEKYAPSTHVIKDPTKRGDMGRFVMDPGIILKGRVVDSQGKPLASVNVEADKRGGIEDFNLPVADHIRRSTTTNDKGEFTFAPLPAAGYEVYPQEQVWDPSKDEKEPKKTPLAAVFVRQHVELKAGPAPEPIEVRAVPHVVIEAQYYDSKGKKTRGHAGHMFGRPDKSTFWFGQAKMDEDGKMTMLVPHGINEAKLSLMTNEHGVLRWRRGKNGPLQAQREIDFGTLTDDIKDIEIIRYVAPILIVDARDKEGKQIKGFQGKLVYSSPVGRKRPGEMFVNGVQGDVFMEKQEDGRWRSSQLLPDEEITVTISADGYKPYTEKIELAEGVNKEIKAELEKGATPEKKKEEEKK